MILVFCSFSLSVFVSRWNHTRNELKRLKLGAEKKQQNHYQHHQSKSYQRKCQQNICVGFFELTNCSNILPARWMLEKRAWPMCVFFSFFGKYVGFCSNFFFLHNVQLMKPQATKFKAIKPKMSTKVHNKSTRIKNMETTFHEQECVRERERTNQKKCISNYNRPTSKQ